MIFVSPNNDYCGGIVGSGPHPLGLFHFLLGIHHSVDCAAGIFMCDAFVSPNTGCVMLISTFRPLNVNWIPDFPIHSIYLNIVSYLPKCVYDATEYG